MQEYICMQDFEKRAKLLLTAKGKLCSCKGEMWVLPTTQRPGSGFIRQACGASSHIDMLK